MSSTATNLNDTIVANGIDALTGAYLLPEQSEQELANQATAEPADKEQLNILRDVARTSSKPHLGALFDVDLTDLKSAGWAIVYHTSEGDDVKKALQPLVTHRQTQIGDDTIFRIMEYRDGETVPQWLARYGMGLGDIDPTKVPYYILLVGKPEGIPFLFGHLLDAVYAVGRLAFETAAEYGSYAQSVIEYETKTPANSRDVYFFGPQHIADKATTLSANSQLTGEAAGGRRRYQSRGSRPARQEPFQAVVRRPLPGAGGFEEAGSG
jgi:hypothetical protein